MELQQIQAIQEHSRLNDKQKRIEELVIQNLDYLKDVKCKFDCLQCGKESEKPKCLNCLKEIKKEKITYLIFISALVFSSVAFFIRIQPEASISFGLCFANLLTNIYQYIIFLKSL